MKTELIYVTGWVGVVPGTPHAARVKEAFALASRQTSTVFVLGSLFADGVSHDDMLTYMEGLDGRLALVVEGSAHGKTQWEERHLPNWQETSRFKKLELWGMKFQLSPDVFSYRPDDGVLIHAEKRQDSGSMITARWDAWHDRFGPGGLHSLYALGVLAGQYATGMAAAEPVDAD